MKAKITKQIVKNGRTSTALKLLKYLSDTKREGSGLKNAELIFCNIPEIDPVDQAKALSDMQKLRPKCKNHVYQTSLSLPIGDDVSHEMWQQLALDYLDEMGLEPTNRPVVIYKHNDTRHKHIHIATSRIGYDGSLWNDGNDIFRAIAITQKLEIMHGLTSTKGFEGKRDVANLTKNEIEMSIRIEELAPKAVIQQAIDLVLSERVSVRAFIEQLAAVGITTKPNCSATTLNGFSFEYKGIPLKSSSLGKSYTLNNLKVRGLDYEQDRDIEYLIARKKAANSKSIGIDKGISDETERNTGINRASDKVDGRVSKESTARPKRNFKGIQRKPAKTRQPDSNSMYRAKSIGGSHERCSYPFGVRDSVNDRSCNDEREADFRHSASNEGRLGRDLGRRREQDPQSSSKVSKYDQGGTTEKAQELANLSDAAAATGGTPECVVATTTTAHILDQSRVDNLCLVMLKKGCARKQIEEVLIQTLPTIEVGHTETNRWVARTIFNALQALENEEMANKNSVVLKGL